jgi:hypothetical protein
LDQLTVDLYNGTGTVSEVRLDVQVRITIVYNYGTFIMLKNTVHYIPMVCLEQGKYYYRKLHHCVHYGIKTYKYLHVFVLFTVLKMGLGSILQNCIGLWKLHSAPVAY